MNESLIALYRRKCLLVCIEELYARPYRGGEGAARVTSAPAVQFASRLLAVRRPGDRTVPCPLLGARLINVLRFQGRFGRC